MSQSIGRTCARYRAIGLSVCVLLAAQLSAQSAPPILRATRELRIDGNTNKFRSLGYVAVNARGDVALWLGSESRIDTFDSAGRRISTIAVDNAPMGTATAPSAGATRGTLMVEPMPPTISNLHWIGDTLVVFQHGAPGSGGRFRVNAYSRVGRLIRTESIQPSSSGFNAKVRDSEGRLIGIAAEPNGRRSQASWSFVSLLPDRSILRLASIPTIDPRFEVLFARTPPYAFAPSGDRFGYAQVDDMLRPIGTFTLSMFSSDGSAVFANQYQYVGVVMSEAEIDSVLNTRQDFGPDGKRINIPVPKSRIPPIYPPVNGLVIGNDNSSWVVMRDEKSHYSAMIIDARGAVDGMVPLQGPRLVAADATHFWLNERDARGVPSLVRYRVAR